MTNYKSKIKKKLGSLNPSFVIAGKRTNGEIAITLHRLPSRHSYLSHLPGRLSLSSPFSPHLPSILTKAFRIHPHFDPPNYDPNPDG